LYLLFLFTIFSFRFKILGKFCQVDIASFFKKVSNVTGIVIARCAKVTDTPEDNNITVFKKGNSQISNTSIPKGGHVQPIETAGLRAI